MLSWVLLLLMPLRLNRQLEAARALEVGTPDDGLSEAEGAMGMGTLDDITVPFPVPPTPRPDIPGQALQGWQARAPWSPQYSWEGMAAPLPPSLPLGVQVGCKARVVFIACVQAAIEHLAISDHAGIGGTVVQSSPLCSHSTGCTSSQQ